MSFLFKKFAIADDRCAMKVGTDGVLLGAWADVSGAARILDIGTGSGLIALMTAQRAPEALVTGIDIDTASVLQARENAAASPFAPRVQILEANVCTFEAQPFNHIVCNPPYHTEPLLPPDTRRAAARHTHGLPLPALIRHAARLLAPGGTLHLILPLAAGQGTSPAPAVLTGAGATVSAAATDCGLHLIRLTYVRTATRKPPRRVLMSWRKPAPQPSGTAAPPLHTSTLVLTAPDGKRTPEHAALTAAFYLQ